MQTGLHCLHCDYDLRGLPGDPVRCPECGRGTRVSEWSATAARRRFERTDALLRNNHVCGVAALLALNGVAAWPISAVLGAVIFGVALLVWLAAFRRAAGLVRGRSGWLRAVLLHQAATLAILVASIVFVASLPAAILGSVWLAGASRATASWIMALTIVGVAVPVAAIELGLLWLLARSKESTDARLRALAAALRDDEREVVDAPALRDDKLAAAGATAAREDEREAVGVPPPQRAGRRDDAA